MRASVGVQSGEVWSHENSTSCLFSQKDAETLLVEELKSPCWFGMQNDWQKPLYPVRTRKWPWFEGHWSLSTIPCHFPGSELVL